ncbi:MAG: hypothetical protein GY930_17340 [bacterium]|nr:hypothetical protein [bacterium]
MPKPNIGRLTAAHTSVVTEQRVLLQVDVSDSEAPDKAKIKASGPQLVWRVSGSASGYVEPRGKELYLFTTGPGELKLSLEVTGSNGTCSEKTIELSVADD